MARKTTKRKTTATKTTKRATAKRTTTKTGEMLLVGSKVKAALKAHGCNVSADAMDGLNDWVHWLIDQAATRTNSNGRKTVRNHDFMAR